MTEEKEEKAVEVVTLSSGETLNKWCMNQFDDLVANQETIWDTLNIVSKLTQLDVVKDENGFVTDVTLIFPQVTEVVTLYALKNFVEHQRLREDDVSAETVLELRRLKLQKFMEGE